MHKGIGNGPLRACRLIKSTTHLTPMLTTETCFKSTDFIAFCEEVERACEKYFTNEYTEPSFCFDDGWELDLILELYNNKCPVPDAINEMCEGIESAEIDAYLSIPSWDR